MEALYRRHRDWSVRLAYRFTRDGETALDAAQDAWVYVLRRLPTLRLGRGDGKGRDVRFTTFLYPAVRSCAVTAIRKRRRDAGATAGLESEPAAPADASLVAAVESLPEGQREVLLMRVVHEMSVRDIGAALGIPEGTVKSRLHAAIRTLREHPGLEGNFGRSVS